VAFKVQDPLGPPDPAANSMAAVSDFKTHWTDRGDAATAGQPDPDIQAALIKATQYLGDWCGYPYSGQKALWNQGAPWPRVGAAILWGPAIPENVVPPGMISATCELAGRALTGIIQPDLPRGGAVKRKTVDVLTTEWFEGAPATTLYTAVQAYICEYLRYGMGKDALMNSPRPFGTPSGGEGEYFHFGMTNDLPSRGGGRR
jgi:hypothetical protein